ncbi:MAG: tRNA lysidine(34) synthetase TilS [Terriglobia bacterium]|jgi:tRNA(Ile)-lysidine synthase
MSRSHDLYLRWAQEMRRNGLLRAGERVGVAVSGGADSVLLLFFMKELARALGLVISAVHFNHHLRGAESDEDERFVSAMAASLGLEFLRSEAEVARVARERRRNLEATARELRYRFFFSLVRRGRLDKVATAHTANDQAETVLLRLLRGTGLHGLGGIFPSLEGKIVRPFLSLTRREIEGELARREIAFRQDSSNRDTRLRRNKVRLEVLPWLEKEFNPEVVSLLKNLADRARDDEEYLEQQARERAQAWRVREGDEERIPARPLAEFPRPLARRVVRQMILGVRGAPHGVTHRQIDSVLRLAAEAQSGRRLALPGQLFARREFEWLVIGSGPQTPAPAEYSYLIEAPAAIALPPLGIILQFKIVGTEAAGEAYNKVREIGLDALKLRGELVVRNWRPGDRFQPGGSHKTLKLKELFRRQRIAAERRVTWPVLESGNEILWVRGFPVAASVAPSRTTSQVLVISEAPIRAVR